VRDCTWGWRRARQVAAVAVLSWGLVPVVGSAQEPAAGAEAEEEEAPPYEVEFIAGTEFQSGTASVRLRSPLVLDAHYFGVEDNEIGMIGLAWTFQKGGLRVLPGVAWAFGSENKPAPVLTLRWSYDSERWITQGLFVQSLGDYVPAHHDGEGVEEDEEVIEHASILDGVHVSAVLGRLELGPMIEHIQYREEDGWKGGARVAWRLGGGVKIAGQIVGPGTEVRAGLAWEP
jgi:hypothetical protein